MCVCSFLTVIIDSSVIAAFLSLSLLSIITSIGSIPYRAQDTCYPSPHMYSFVLFFAPDSICPRPREYSHCHGHILYWTTKRSRKGKCHSSLHIPHSIFSTTTPLACTRQRSLWCHVPTGTEDRSPSHDGQARCRTASCAD